MRIQLFYFQLSIWNKIMKDMRDWNPEIWTNQNFSSIVFWVNWMLGQEY